jgi:hypothetical protein
VLVRESRLRLNAKSLAPVSSLVHWYDFRRNCPHRTDDSSTSNTAERPRQDQPCDGLDENKREIIKREIT